MLDFINRERIYILMLVFILAVNVLNAGHKRSVPDEDEKAVSTMTFKEAGITEEKVKDYLQSDKFSAKFFKYSIPFGFLIFIMALVSNLNFIFRRKRVYFMGADNKKPVPWGIPDLIRAVIAILFSAYLIGIAEGFLFKAFQLNIETNLRMIIGTFFIDIAVIMIIFYFVVVKHREMLQLLGLRSRSFLRDILSGVGSYIFILPLLCVILLVSVWILNILGYTPPPQPVFEAFMKGKESRTLLFLTMFVSVFGPVVEEMFFRGFMYSAIKKRTGALIAAVLSASIFSLLHTNIVGFFPIMALGILLAYLYETTGSLVAPMAVHILHNSIIVAFVFFIRQLI